MGISLLGLDSVQRRQSVCNSLQPVLFACNFGRVSFWAYRPCPSVTTDTTRCDQNHRRILVLAKTLRGGLLPVTAVLTLTSPFCLPGSFFGAHDARNV
jgi:hypothetical protein